MKTRSKRSKRAEPKQTKEDKPDLLIRSAQVEVRAAQGDNPPEVRMSVSSEEPVLTYIYFNEQWQRAYEILDHGSGSVDLSRAKEGLVVLDRHYGDQIGLMEVNLENRKLGGPVSFCTGARAQEILQDAAKGLRRNVSVGYTVNVDSYKLEGDQDGIPVVRAMSWMPYEASFEPVPADTTVGVNRADQTMAKQTAQKATVVKQEERKMNPKEMAELFARAAKYGIEADVVQGLIADGKGRAELDALIVEKQEKDAETLRKEVVELKERKPEEQKKPDKPGADEIRKVAPIGGSPEAEAKAVRKFSVMNVLRHFAGMKVDIGYEREISEECSKLRGKPAEGIIIPFGALAKRDFTVSGTSSSSVATDLYSGEFIDLLRSKYILGQLGCQFLTGLVGDVAIPKMTAGATGYWVTEGSDVTESAPTLGQVTGSPHTAGALVDISRKLLIQSTPDAEDMVRMEVMERVLRTVQIAVFAGTGANGQPSAITNASGINNPTVTQGTPTHAEILGFVADIMSDSASAPGQKWAMTGEVWAKLADTDVDSGSGLKVLDYKSKTVVGYPYVDPSSDLPANSLWFGNWASVVIGVWGNGVDVATTDSKLFASGGLTVRALQDVDVMVRLGQSLAYNTEVTT